MNGGVGSEWKMYCWRSVKESNHLHDLLYFMRPLMRARTVKIARITRAARGSSDVCTASLCINAFAKVRPTPYSNWAQAAARCACVSEQKISFMQSWHLEMRAGKQRAIQKRDCVMQARRRRWCSAAWQSDNHAPVNGLFRRGGNLLKKLRSRPAGEGSCRQESIA